MDYPLAGGTPWTPTFHSHLTPITGDEVRTALRAMKQGKAIGADGWRPHELAALPVPWTDRLATFMNQWESAGRWPEPLRQNIIALVPKPGATHEKTTPPHRLAQLCLQGLDGHS